MNKIRLVLLGKTGSGKSATGNYIMGQKHFASKLSGKSVTKKCSGGFSRHSDRELFIVDTPGLFDTSLSIEQIRQGIIKCIQYSVPGPHVFLLTVSIGRFTEEEIQTFNHLIDTFGEHMENFTIVALTRFDDVKRDNSTIEEFIESSDVLKSFVRRCNGRYFAFDNTEILTDVRTKEMDQLIKLIDATIQSNGGKHYSNEMYIEAKNKLQRKLKEDEVKLAAEKDKEIRQIESAYAKQIYDANQRNEDLAKQIGNAKFLKEQIQNDIDRVMSEIIEVKEKMNTSANEAHTELEKVKQQADEEKKDKLVKIKKQDELNSKILEQILKLISDLKNQRTNLELQKNKELKQVKIEQETLFKGQFEQLKEENRKKKEKYKSNVEEKNKQLQKLEKDHTETVNRLSEKIKLFEEQNRKTEEQYMSIVEEKNKQIQKQEKDNNEKVSKLNEKVKLLEEKANSSSCTIS